MSAPISEATSPTRCVANAPPPRGPPAARTPPTSKPPPPRRGGATPPPHFSPTHPAAPIASPGKIAPPAIWPRVGCRRGTPAGRVVRASPPAIPPPFQRDL